MLIFAALYHTYQMAEQSLKDKTAKGLFWGGVSNGVQQLLGMLFGIYLARTLNAEDYGLVGMLAIFSGIAGTIINSGFTVALTNKQEVTHKEYNAVFWFMVFTGLLLYVILFFSAPLIAGFYKRPELIALSRVLYISFFLAGIAGVPYTVMFRKLMVKEQAKIDIVSLLLSGIVGVSLAVSGFAYWALAIQSLVYVGMSSLLKCYISPWRPTFELDFRPLKGMFSFSVKLFLTNVFTQINNNIFSVLLGRFYSANQVGYYSQGNKWMTMGGSVICGMINSVAQPIFARSSTDKDYQVKIFRKMLRFTAFVSFPLMLGLAFISKEFVLLILGEKWSNSISILQLLCIWGAISPIQVLYSQIVISCGRSDFYLNNHVVIGLIQFFLAFYMTRYGILAMTAGYVGVYSIIWMLMWHVYLSKLVPIRLSSVLCDIMPYLVLTLSSISIVFFITKNMENLLLLLILKIILVAILYILFVWLTGSKIFKESIVFIKGLKS